MAAVKPRPNASPEVSLLRSKSLVIDIAVLLEGHSTVRLPTAHLPAGPIAIEFHCKFLRSIEPAFTVFVPKV